MTSSVVFASTKRSTNFMPFVVPKNLFASAILTVFPNKPAAERAATSSSAVISDVAILVPLPRITDNAWSTPLRTSPPLPASAATFMAVAPVLNPGKIGVATATAASKKPDIKLYALDCSSKTSPAIPRPIVQA